MRSADLLFFYYIYSTCSVTNFVLSRPPASPSVSVLSSFFCDENLCCILGLRVLAAGLSLTLDWRTKVSVSSPSQKLRSQFWLNWKTSAISHSLNIKWHSLNCCKIVVMVMFCFYRFICSGIDNTFRWRTSFLRWYCLHIGTAAFNTLHVLLSIIPTFLTTAGLQLITSLYDMVSYCLLRSLPFPDTIILYGCWRR